ncbi:MAG: hypothetical protein RLY89_211 [Bacteroidota bacterium]|jgi:hypothetical protein
MKVTDTTIYTALSKCVSELANSNPDLLSPLANPDGISFFLFNQISTHLLPRTKMLTVKVNVPLEESALLLLYEALEILAKKYRFQIVKA